MSKNIIEQEKSIQTNEVNIHEKPKEVLIYNDGNSCGTQCVATSAGMGRGIMYAPRDQIFMACYKELLKICNDKQTSKAVLGCGEMDCSTRLFKAITYSDILQYPIFNALRYLGWESLAHEIFDKIDCVEKNVIAEHISPYTVKCHKNDGKYVAPIYRTLKEDVKHLVKTVDDVLSGRTVEPKIYSTYQIKGQEKDHSYGIVIKQETELTYAGDNYGNYVKLHAGIFLVTMYVTYAAFKASYTNYPFFLTDSQKKFESHMESFIPPQLLDKLIVLNMALFSSLNAIYHYVLKPYVLNPQEHDQLSLSRMTEKGGILKNMQCPSDWSSSVEYFNKEKTGGSILTCVSPSRATLEETLIDFCNGKKIIEQVRKSDSTIQYEVEFLNIPSSSTNYANICYLEHTSDIELNGRIQE